MIFYNKIFTNIDLEEAKKWRDDSGYAEEYPRSNDPCPEKNFWYRPDTICKWTSILRMFELIEKDGLFTDLVQRVQEKVSRSFKRSKKPEPVPTIEKKKTWSWEQSY